MEENLKEKAELCLKTGDYKRLKELKRAKYEETKTDDAKLEYEKAIEIFQISKEIEDILNSDHGDYYRILGVQPNASINEIKKAFRVKAFRYHPDRLKIEGATNVMRIIQKAYFEINTEEKKAAYDATRNVPKILRNYVNSDDFTNIRHQQSDFTRPVFFYSNGYNGFSFSASFGSSNDVIYGRSSFDSLNNIYERLYRSTSLQRTGYFDQSFTYIAYIVAIIIVFLSIL